MKTVTGTAIHGSSGSWIPGAISHRVRDGVFVAVAGRAKIDYVGFQKNRVFSTMSRMTAGAVKFLAMTVVPALQA